jgi:hypothetical protein
MRIFRFICPSLELPRFDGGFLRQEGSSVQPPFERSAAYTGERPSIQPKAYRGRQRSLEDAGRERAAKIRAVLARWAGTWHPPSWCRPTGLLLGETEPNQKLTPARVHGSSPWSASIREMLFPASRRARTRSSTPGSILRPRPSPCSSPFRSAPPAMDRRGEASREMYR